MLRPVPAGSRAVPGQDAASLCDACSREIHEANPLAGRHVVEPAKPFANPRAAGPATGPFTLNGTRVAASANTAEIEEYQRRCEEVLNGEDGSGGADIHGSLQTMARPDAARGSGAQERGAAGGYRRGEAALDRGAGASGDGDRSLDHFDALFGSDFAELESDGPLEFTFLQAHGAL